LRWIGRSNPRAVCHSTVNIGLVSMNLDIDLATYILC